MRERVYARRVKQRLMLQTDADYEIAIMKAIELDYAAAVAIDQAE